MKQNSDTYFNVNIFQHDKKRGKKKKRNSECFVFNLPDESKTK